MHYAISFLGAILGAAIGVFSPELIRVADYKFEQLSYNAGSFVHWLKHDIGCAESYYINATKYDRAYHNLNDLIDKRGNTGADEFLTNYQDQLSDALTAYKDLKNVYTMCSGISANDSVDRERLEYVEKLFAFSEQLTATNERSASLKYEINSLASGECHNLYKHVSSNRSNDEEEVYNTFNHMKRANSYSHIAERCIGVEIRDGQGPEYERTYINGVLIELLF